jgi:structure-specific endonuclease subunit SLX1
VPSLLANLHLLLRVPSFSRWPLELRFFAPDVHEAFLRVSAQALDSLRPSLPIILDFPPAASTKAAEQLLLAGPQSANQALHGIAALAIDYAPHRAHVEKSKDILDFEREGACSVCSETLDHGAGIYTVCPHAGCESVSHLACLARHFLNSEPDRDAIVPIQGTCKDCGKLTRWVDIVKDVTLRMRGEKEVTKLLKLPRQKATAKTAAKTGKSKEQGAAVPAEIIYSSDIESDEEGSELDTDGFRDLDNDDADSELGVPKDDTKYTAHNNNTSG